jgi:hypothetical protein
MGSGLLHSGDRCGSEMLLKSHCHNETPESREEDGAIQRRRIADVTTSTVVTPTNGGRHHQRAATGRRCGAVLPLIFMRLTRDGESFYSFFSDQRGPWP